MTTYVGAHRAPEETSDTAQATVHDLVEPHIRRDGSAQVQMIVELEEGTESVVILELTDEQRRKLSTGLRRRTDK